MELNYGKPEKDFKNIHTPLHLFIDETIELFGDRKKNNGVGSFSFYLGKIKDVPLQELFEIRARVQQTRGVKNPVALFFYLVKNRRAS